MLLAREVENSGFESVRSLRSIAREVLLNLVKPLSSSGLAKLILERRNGLRESVVVVNPGFQSRVLLLGRLLLLEDEEVKRKVVFVNVGTFGVFIPVEWMRSELKRVDSGFSAVEG